MADTVREMLLAHAERDTPGVKFGDRTWTWREYVDEGRSRAAALAGLLDPARPPHVGTLLQNTPEMVLALAASALGGYVTVGVNDTRRGAALARDVVKADCQVLLTDRLHLPLLDGLDLGGARVIDTDGDEWASMVKAADPLTEPVRVPTADDTFMLIFTSGTSGDPKAVRVGNAIVALGGLSLTGKYGLGPGDTCYLSMPLFHSNAIISGFAVALASGAAMALTPRFSAGSFLSDIRRYGATYMNYVGKPLAYILETPRRPDDAENPLKHAFGNEANDRDIAAFAERFGCDVWDGFGSTETAVIITRVDGTPPGSIGQPWDGVAVYDRTTRTECPRAEFDEHGKVTNLDAAVGELVNTQGGGFFAGYYNDPEATSNRLDGGMYWSGDLAYRDAAGFVYLAGRTSDWLRVDGENMAAGIIENILGRHPAVSRVAVYGVPDPRSGDRLVAALVLHDEPELGPDEFEAFLAAQPDLSPKAWPQYVRVASDLPSTATNKVLKRELVNQGLDFADVRWTRDERGTRYRVTTGTP